METPDAGQNIITRGLPKTGQVVEYQGGDDGTYEAGWWKGRLNANNRERWIAKTIGGDDIVLDRAAGLMWAADRNAAGCNNGAGIAWGAAITYANGLTFAGFTDWRLPNIKELVSLVNYSLLSPTIDQPPFVSTLATGYWSSTTFIVTTTSAWLTNFSDGSLYILAKTSEKPIRCVRKGV